MALERSARTCPSLPGRRPRRWAERDEACPTRVLVVTGTIPGTLVGAEGLVEVVESLARCASTRVTLACADGFGASRYGGHYQRQGVEVIAGPVDWPAWCADRRYHYSHVLVSDEGLTTPPCGSSCGRRSPRPWRSCTPNACRSGGPRRWATRVGTPRGPKQSPRSARRSCSTRLKASRRRGARAPRTPACLRVSAPSCEVSRFGAADSCDQGAVKGYADREGVVLVATDNFDVSGDAEEPVVRALEELVPAWRRRDMSLRVRVVSDWPTPGLAEAAGRFGAEVVPSGGDLVGCPGHGQSGPVAGEPRYERLVLGAGSHGGRHALVDHRQGRNRHLPRRPRGTGSRRRRRHDGPPGMGPAHRRAGLGEISRLLSRPGLPASSPNVKRPCVPPSLLRASTHPKGHAGPWNACRRTRRPFR